MTTHDLLSHFCLENAYEVGRYLLLREHLRRADPLLVLRDLRGAVTPAALPERACVVSTVRQAASSDVVAEVDGVLVLLHCYKAGGSAWASGVDEQTVTRVLDEISARVVRAPVPRQVEVTFTDQWNTRNVDLDVRPWPEIEPLYTPAVAATLGSLMSHVGSPDEARRLLLWHGAPGTGKTSAIRALLLAWREWADGIVVTDPEALLGDGRYLRRVVLDADDEEDRWLLLVLEDAESLLHKGTGGKGMAKLLNL